MEKEKNVSFLRLCEIFSAQLLSEQAFELSIAAGNLEFSLRDGCLNLLFPTPWLLDKRVLRAELGWVEGVLGSAAGFLSLENGFSYQFNENTQSIEHIIRGLIWLNDSLALGEDFYGLLSTLDEIQVGKSFPEKTVTTASAPQATAFVHQAEASQPAASAFEAIGSAPTLSPSNPTPILQPILPNAQQPQQRFSPSSPANLASSYVEPATTSHVAPTAYTGIIPSTGFVDLHLIHPGYSKDRLLQLLTIILSVSRTDAEEITQNTPCVLIPRIEAKLASNYADLLTRAGANINVVPV